MQQSVTSWSAWSWRFGRRRHGDGDEENMGNGLRRRMGWLHGARVCQLAKSVAATTNEEEEGKKDAKKLGTFSGVWVPTTLNVLSILMFLRFGFILGQGGVVGMLGMLIGSYIINLITTLSLSAISSNGTVRGGGAYYLISRSLGPEFGGSIGLVFYLGFVFNTGMNAVGLIDCVINNFGNETGTMSQIVPESFWWRYLYATGVLVFCTLICLLGSAIFSRASNFLLAILLVATFSIPISGLIRKPFKDHRSGISYTGISMETFMENLMPLFTKGAAGSTAPGKENWQDLFGILFPATAGIFAGASMSGDLKNPSKSIPAGTLNGLLFTFVTYTLVILSVGATITRDSLYKDLNVIQHINLSPNLILMGEFATTFFSALMGVIGSAKSLQALARDNVFPGLSVFGQGSKRNDEPTVAILFTYVLSQLTLLMDINTIASFVTMTYLITFWVTNFACFLLEIGSAPNFRPTFKFFTWWTAAVGAVISVATMFFVDGIYASGVVGLILALFLIIHYFTPPKSWGDVSQSLIYHQVRKYLLRLRQEHVKFWRPQILLLVNDPRRSWKLIQFCNAMKKGGLYVLGHIIVTTDFQDSFHEVKKQQSAWMKYIDFSRIKAFPQVAIAPTFEWGARNIVLSAGLGGMRPNIAVLGFYNLAEHRNSTPLIDLGSDPQSSGSVSRNADKDGANDVDQPQGQLPTDTMRSENAVSPMSYVNILEDFLLCLQINVAIAKGFNGLELPKPNKRDAKKKYIDLWPIQMSAEINDDEFGAVLTQNFDTYTLILQLGCILNTVPAWKKSYQLRVAVFVEYETDVQEESDRVKKLLENLRIQAEVLVVWLANGSLRTYEVIVNGADPGSDMYVEQMLGKEKWWKELKQRRKPPAIPGRPVHIDGLSQLVEHVWPNSSFLQLGRSENAPVRFGRGLKKIFGKTKRHRSLSGLRGVPTFRTQRLDPDTLIHHGSASEPEASSDEESVVSSVASDTYARDSSDPENDEFGFRRRRRASTGNALTGYWCPTAGAPGIRELSTVTGINPCIENEPNLLAPPTSHLEVRPRTVSRESTPSFSCKAIPDTRLSTTDGPGPSIMFADDPALHLGNKSKKHGSASASSAIVTASGNMRQKAVVQEALSFNDLPSHGQHLILNELMKQHSVDTAVLFTTLPSPPAASCKSETASMEYLRGLELLTADLPPILLIHSNTLTVTTAL